jgi:hypothetical protein
MGICNRFKLTISFPIKLHPPESATNDQCLPATRSFATLMSESKPRRFFFQHWKSTKPGLGLQGPRRCAPASRRQSALAALL